MRGVDDQLWEISPPAPCIYVGVFDEDGAPPLQTEDELELQVLNISRPDNRMVRLMNTVNLMMSDSLRELAQARSAHSLRSPPATHR